MKADIKWDYLRKNILELLSKSDTHYIDLEKKMHTVLSICDK
jgi:hypothetical protein